MDMPPSDINSLKIGIVFMMILFIIGIANSGKYNIAKIYKSVALLVIINLLLTILTPQLSILNLFSTDTMATKDLWAIRGQIGDILSGHFTALAFIGLLMSLYYQRKSIDQMQDSIKQNNKAINQNNEVIKLQNISIEQQNKALMQQTESMSIQIKEFEAQTQQFKNQTVELSEQRKEMETSKLYRQFEFYYGQLEELKKSTPYFIANSSIGKISKKQENFIRLLTDAKTNNCFIYENDIDNILEYYKFILNEINVIKDKDIKSDLMKFYQLYIKSMDMNLIKELKFKAKIFSEVKLTSINTIIDNQMTYASYMTYRNFYENISYIAKNSLGYNQNYTYQKLYAYEVLENLKEKFKKTDYVQSILEDKKSTS